VDQGAGRRGHRRSRPFYEGLIAELVEHVRGEFYLGTRQKDGSTLRDNLLSVQKQTGIRPKELDVPDCPPGLEYVRDWFYELHGERGVGSGMSDAPVAITSEKLAAWTGLRGIRLLGVELEILGRLDRLFLSQKFKRKEEDGH
jgi:hypothetical protein